MSASLPDYVASAKPNSLANRAPWHKTIAPTYAGVMLWFVFWQSLATAEKHAGGTLAAGIGTALLGIVVAALICHFLFYYVPGLLGMKTGLPLYVVGTSTYGVVGGLILPGLVMGVLQFGWIGVNAYGVAELLCKGFGVKITEGVVFPIVNPVHAGIAIVFAAGCAFMGLKGIQYVAKVATFLPLIPIAVLVVLLVKTVGGIGNFTPEQVQTAGGKEAALSGIQILTFLTTVIVGFFATAGAAGTDIAMAGRDPKDVQLGGMVGIVLSTIFAGGLAVIVVAGAYGGGLVPAAADNAATSLNPLDLMKGGLLSQNVSNIFMILLAISSFPGGCFSAFIAANSFKTTMPKVNPWLSVGLGTIVSIILAVTGLTGKVVQVFSVIGASFGPVCGAMVADFLLSGRKWNGPRAGFNPAGWISWALGFVVGSADFIPQLAGKIPCPPVAAFIVGFVVYLVLAMIGLQSRTLEMPAEKAA